MRLFRYIVFCAVAFVLGIVATISTVVLLARDWSDHGEAAVMWDDIDEERWHTGFQ